MSTSGRIGMTRNRIVITGGIATGKSTASDYLRSRGYPVIDADAIAKRALEPGMLPYRKVIEAFGSGILNGDGTIDRTALGRLVFGDTRMLGKLNRITHPWIYAKMEAELTEHAGEPVVFLDIPLHYESRMFEHLPVWLIYAPEPTQLSRLIKRNNLAPDDAISRIRSQMPIEEKKKRAEVVLDNSGSIEQLHKQLDEALKNLK